MEIKYYGMVLRTIRISKDMPVKELAQAMHVNSTYISDIESGRKKPSIDMLERFSDGLQIPLDVVIKFLKLAKDENLSYVETLKLSVDFECERLKNQEQSV